MRIHRGDLTEGPTGDLTAGLAKDLTGDLIEGMNRDSAGNAAEWKGLSKILWCS